MRTVISRRRRGTSQADRALRAVLGDAALIGWYDTRFPWTVTQSANAVSQWDDARGASGYAPGLVQATAGAKPTWSSSAQTITFDGTADFLRADSATWNTITAACAIVVVGTLPTTGAGSAERIVEISTAAGASVLMAERLINDGNFRAGVGGAAFAADVAAEAGRVALHSRRTASSGGNITVGARVNDSAEGTAAGAASDATANRVTVGANRVDVASQVADIVVRAVLVIKGTYTTAQQNAVNEWARAVHGATI